jgi:hypothetical protein
MECNSKENAKLTMRVIWKIEERVMIWTGI